MALKLDAIGKKIGPLKKSYTWKDVVTYALGVGAGFSELQYCYEKDLKVLPSFSIVTLYDFMPELAEVSGVNMAGILHGEQELIFHNPIPPEGTLITEGAISHYYDRGKEKGAVIVAEFETHHSNGRKLFTCIATVLARLDGGFGGKEPPKEEIDFPDMAPDAEVPDTPSAAQPLFFRLSGDIFPLHVDSEFARMAGFDKPIMHGLCTHGFACRALIRELVPGEPERISRLKVRFSKPLYPGVPIKTQLWKQEEGRALFRTLNAETGDVVIDRGIVEWLGPEGRKREQKEEGIRFDDRVAIVTGAGGGLGRVYALELARRGAKVVVNDFGGGKDGRGGGERSAADKVVEEIRALGGEAVANYESVATPGGGEAIVECALKAFGRVDILINNAGILRDKTLAKMEPESWDGVMEVHLKGAYNVTRPAFLKMREQGYGRIVLTSSAAGLYGNFGQTNYSAAKMGLVGFMNTLKLEGEKHNIEVNTVAPIAGTRLTEGVLPPEVFEKLKPEFIAPLVLYLSSEGCRENGMIFNAGMGYFNRVGIVTGPGAFIGEGKSVPSVEDIQQYWDAINDLSGAQEYPNAVAAFGPLLDAVSGKKAPAGGAGGEVAVKDIFERIPEAFQAEKAVGVDVVFQFEISGPGGGSWHVTVKDQRCEVKGGAHDRPTTTIKMGDEDFVKLIKGELNAMKAYTGGKLKIGGDLMKSQLIEKLFKF
jgi:NAD(P)-dependent dehydrogenase (short-subunit alcohol dehydrogenase family)/acyl dehydratase/putative sterol carrier protein